MDYYPGAKAELSEKEEFKMQGYTVELAEITSDKLQMRNGAVAENLSLMIKKGLAEADDIRQLSDGTVLLKSELAAKLRATLSPAEPSWHPESQINQKERKQKLADFLSGLSWEYYQTNLRVRTGQSQAGGALYFSPEIYGKFMEYLQQNRKPRNSN
jgi:hypothetical protein